MAMTISGSNGVTYPDGTVQASGSQACKAWVNFNGTGTVAIRASYNVSSITDNGTGDYTVNFTTALQDANYCWSYAMQYANTGAVGNAETVYCATRNGTGSVANSSIRLTTNIYTNTTYDCAQVCVSIFR